jgi:hypothetical protein
VGDVAEVTGAVKRVRAALDQVGGVSDVVHPSRTYEYFGVGSNEVSNRLGLAANAL